MCGSCRMAAHPASLNDVRVSTASGGWTVRRTTVQGSARELPGALDLGDRGVPAGEGLLVGHAAEDIAAVSRDWRRTRQSSAHHGDQRVDLPHRALAAMFTHGPAQARPRQAALQKDSPQAHREHEDEIRAIVVRVLDRLEGREEAELVSEVAQPSSRASSAASWASRGGRHHVGAPDEQPARCRRGGARAVRDPRRDRARHRRAVRRCQSLINERRERPPTT